MPPAESSACLLQIGVSLPPKPISAEIGIFAERKLSFRERKKNMYRVGIIGTENSHALAFARLLNLPQNGAREWEDVKITGICGPEESNRQIQEKTGVDFIASGPEDFFGKVDAMMITSRKGSLHAGYAMPFIERGIPLFIDKPFTSDPEEAKTLIREAEKRGVPITGGSGCKYACDVQMLAHTADTWKAEGKLLSGAINFSADRDSVYDGFYFYAPHLTEMGLTVFGYDMKSVRAFESAGGVTVAARYKDFDATLHYTKNSAVSTGVLFGKDKNAVREIDISLIYRHEVEHFVQMLRTGKMPLPYDRLIRHVTVIAAILRSLESGKEEAV